MMKEIFKNTLIMTKHYTIEEWMENLAMQMVNELLNDVCAFDTDDGEQTVLFVCPECGECLAI